MKLILASSSKNRQDLFDMIGLKYEVVKSLVEERSTSSDPRQYVIDLSKDKANSVASQINEKAIIIAADTIMYMDGKIFEKPRSKEEASLNMKLMSGKIVYGITGVTIKDLSTNKEVSFTDTAEIHLKSMDNDEIAWYVENDKNVLNRCGFSIEGKASVFVDKIVGDYNTIRGISVSKLFSKFKELEININDLELNN